MVRAVQLKKPIFSWGPVVLWMGLIYFISSVPGLSVGEGAVDFLTRKPAHVVEYAVLFLLLHRALHDSFSLVGKKLYLAAGIFTFLYAITDEVHQIFVPLREGRILDLGFDLLGIFGALIFLRFYPRNPDKEVDI